MLIVKQKLKDFKNENRILDTFLFIKIMLVLTLFVKNILVI